MSLSIGTRTFDVSNDFKKSFERLVSSDKVLDKNELELLRQSARGTAESELVNFLEQQKDSSNIKVDFDNTDNDDTTTDVQFKFSGSEIDQASEPVSDVFKFPKSEEKGIAREVSAVKYLTRLTEVVGKEDLEKLLDIFGTSETKELNDLLEKIPDQSVKKIITDKVSQIIKSEDISPAKKTELLKTIKQETGNFIKSQEAYLKQSKEVLPSKVEKITKSIKSEIASTESQISQLKELISKNGSSPALDTQLQQLETKLTEKKDLLTKTEGSLYKRRIGSVEEAYNKTNLNRFNDVLDSLTAKFGPPYQGAANEVNEFLNKNPEIKQIFNSPEDVNIAIRKKPSDLSDIERSALKQIRESFFSVPPEGKTIAKIILPDSKLDLKGFVIDPERLKGIKSEEDLINVLRLDFGVNTDGVAKFKLSDVKVVLGKVFPDELSVAFSREFGGVRDIDIYTYPYSGSGFTTPIGQFPEPESDLGKLSIDNTKVVEFDKFLETPIEDIEIPPRGRELKGIADNIGKSGEKLSEKGKTLLTQEVEAILKDKNIPPSQKERLLKSIEGEVLAFDKRQVDLSKQLDELKAKYGEPLINTLRTDIKSTKDQIRQLEKSLNGAASPQLDALKLKLKDLETQYSNIDGRRLDSLEKTLSETDEVRLNDVVATARKSFGPPYTDPVAKQVNDLLEANPELKKVFNSPEEVNLAIRKFPSELKPEELGALKTIRESFYKVPAEGLPVVKVSFPGKTSELQKFVIEAEHLKSIKTEEELIDALKLDYHGSPFIKDGKPTFKLSDIDVTVGRAFPDELSVPFSKEFGGTRDAIIYSYPFSGNGFTTPENGFPRPELDLGAKPIKEVQTVKWTEFVEKSVNDLAPPRVNPNPQPAVTPDKTPRAEKPVVDKPVDPVTAKPEKAPEVKTTVEEKPKTPETRTTEERPKVNQPEAKPRAEEVKPSVDAGSSSPTAKVAGELETDAIKKIDSLPVNSQTKALLKELAEKPEFKGNQNAINNIIDAFDKAVSDEKSIEILTETVKNLDAGTLAKVFSEAEKAGQVVSLVKKAVTIFAKYGLAVGEVVAKVGKGLLKALPVIGAVASGYDTQRLARLAVTGVDPASGKDFRSYPQGDPRNTPENLEKLKDLRSLALLGSAANGLDTVLAVIEATGIGNVDAFLQIGLAGVEVVIDLALDYFREHPDKLPDGLSKTIRAAALTAELASPVPTPISKIYNLGTGPEAKIEAANQLTKLLKDPVIGGLKKLGDLSANSLDKQLDSVAGNINQLADIIRNPEKYAQAFGASVEEVIAKTKAKVINLLNKGGKVAQQVYNTLADIASNPKKYGKQLADSVMQFGKEVTSKVKDVYNASINFTKNLLNRGAITIEQAYESLKGLTSKAGNAAKQLITDLIKDTKALGGKFTAFVKDFYQNPRKYGNMAVEIIGELKNSIVNGSTAAFNKLKQVADSGVALAKQAISKTIDQLATAGKLTYDLAKYVVQNPGEATQKVLQATKDLLIEGIKSGKQIYNDALDNLQDLYKRTGAALGRFEDTLVDFAKSGGKVVNEIFTKHFDVIKNRLPEILDATGNLGSAITDRLVQLVPADKLINSLINNGTKGFKTFLDLASKYGNIASNFINKVTSELSKAYEKCTFTDISPLLDVAEKYYDQASKLSGAALQKIKQLVYQAAQKLDKNVLGDKIPDRLIDALLKP